MRSKKLVKVLVFVLVIALLPALMLTACGQNNGAKDESTASSQATTAATSQESTQAQLNPYELAYYYAGPAQADQQAVQDELDKLLKERINATIVLNRSNFSEFTNKMNVMLATGEKVDLCFTTQAWVNPYGAQVANGSFLALEDLLQKYGQDIKKQVPEGWWDAPKIKGKIYAVPNIQYAATTNGVLIRKDLAEKYNLDVTTLKSFFDLEPFLEQIKKNEKDIIPFESSQGRGPRDDQSYGIMNLEVYAAVNMNTDSYKVLSCFEQPHILEQMRKIYSWAQNGYFPTDCATKSDTEAERKANKLAVLLMGNLAPYYEYDYKSQYGVDTIPVMFGKPIMDTGSVTATMNAIPKPSKDPERAMMFLNLLFGDKQVYTTLCDGIENVHYTKAGDNTIEVVKDSKYAPGTAWEFGNAFNDFARSGDPADKVQKQKEGNDNAIISPLMGFQFDPTPVKTELAQMDAAKGEYFNGLMAGAMDPDVYLPKFIDKLKKAGIDKFVAEMQKQIDDWRAANGK
jgi:putative aldouronate transport system substrate-binding protein